jgi:DNA-binding transcriptional MocR family regulator
MSKWTEADIGIVPSIGDWRSAWRGPLYARLARALQDGIERGDLAAGSRLPPERPLAEALGVSRTTVVLAYGQLRRQALLESRQGSGTWVPRRAGGPSRRAHMEEGRRSFLVDAVTRAAAEEPADSIGFMGACLPAAGRFLDAAWQAAQADVSALARGAGYSPQGLPALRQEVAARYQARGLPTAPDEILITGGAQQAIDILARFLVGEGDGVVLEDPTYPGAIDAFALARARLLPVAVGRAGADTAALARLVAQAKPALVYLVATFHNPTGTVLPEAGRRDVARLAAETGVTIVEDESLADLSFGSEPPPPIAAFAPRASLLTVGSTSKLFWAGLRVGWIRGPRPLIARLTRSKVVADLSGSVVSQALAARLLPRRDEIVRVRRREIRSRFEYLAEQLRQRLPEWSFVPPEGGLTLWVRLPVANAEELARIAPRYGVSIVPGPVHSPKSGFTDHLRLPFVMEESLIAEGIARLARAWEACRRPHDEGRLGVIV